MKRKGKVISPGSFNLYRIRHNLANPVPHLSRVPESPEDCRLICTVYYNQEVHVI